MDPANEMSTEIYNTHTREDMDLANEMINIYMLAMANAGSKCLESFGFR
jgi:hypothetical protein